MSKSLYIRNEIVSIEIFELLQRSPSNTEPRIRKRKSWLGNGHVGDVLTEVTLAPLASLLSTQLSRQCGLRPLALRILPPLPPLGEMQKALSMAGNHGQHGKHFKHDEQGQRGEHGQNGEPT